MLLSREEKRSLTRTNHAQKKMVPKPISERREMGCLEETVDILCFVHLGKYLEKMFKSVVFHLQSVHCVKLTENFYRILKRKPRKESVLSACL